MLVWFSLDRARSWRALPLHSHQAPQHVGRALRPGELCERCCWLAIRGDRERSAAMAAPGFFLKLRNGKRIADRPLRRQYAKGNGQPFKPEVAVVRLEEDRKQFVVVRNSIA